MATATEPTIEQRLKATEIAIDEIRQQLPSRADRVRDWLQQVRGCMKDKAAFREMIAYGQAYRDADRPPTEEPS